MTEDNSLYKCRYTVEESILLECFCVGRYQSTITYVKLRVIAYKTIDVGPIN